MLKIDLAKIEDVSKECRRLKEEGHPDQEVYCYRGDMLCLTVKSLFKQAGLTIRNEPHLHYVKFVPFVKTWIDAK